MFDTNNWPSLGEELGRKITEVLEKRLTQYEEGKLSFREIYLIVSDLYDTTSGLAPSDITNMLADVHQGLRLEQQRKERTGT
ncbi:hypothetical protein [Agrobacterium sp. CG674]